ncbi:hypothetical protein MITS9508_00045 [Synechococcus sp. MIT S9508]|nr:hypothetical protein MITS9508_00045 [Synechococcus sp. MIT S9508]
MFVLKRGILMSFSMVLSPYIFRTIVLIVFVFPSLFGLKQPLEMTVQ